MNKTHDYFDEIIKSCAGEPPLLTAVVHPVRAVDIQATFEAERANLITPILVGPRPRIEAAAKEAKIDISSYKIVDAEHSHDSARVATDMASQGEVMSLMKGALHSDEILHTVIISKALRTESRISHAYLMDIPTYHKPFVISDAVVNIAPDLDAKVDICQNAVYFWQAMFGMDKKPKVAVLAAVETVSSKMQATIDAACLCKMADRGQIYNAIIDGPLAFDNAIDVNAAVAKSIVSNVAGDADIVIPPNLESANILAKQMTFLGNARAAGIVIGARVPVILTSRADSLQTRLMSCVLALKVHKARSLWLFK